MQIVCISKGTYGGGKQLAERLAEKIGCKCLSREDLSDGATYAGIPVGKLETTVWRRRPLSERMAIEKDRFKAFVTSTLAQNALKGSLVYHGRTGHLQLPGVAHVLRVRAIMDPEMRVELTMQRLGLSRAKAIRYNTDVDEDRHRWARTLYNVDWEDPGNYDAVVNLSRVSPENAAAALVSVAGLPEFQATPASERTLEDLALAAQCRLQVGTDPRTRNLDVQVKAERGSVLVTYLPRQNQLARLIPEVLRDVEGVEELVCTMASTNLLWVQERYDPNGDTLRQVLDIAGRWNAAVELVHLVGERDKPGADELRQEGDAQENAEMTAPEESGGVLDDTHVSDEHADEDIRSTMGQLIAAGRAGGYREVRGGPKDLVGNLDRTTGYSLVVVGDVFLSKAENVRKRLSRELVGYLSDVLHVPAVGAEELQAEYLFGSKHWLKLLGYAALTTVLLLAVFSHQDTVLTFLSRPGGPNRILAAATLFVLIPLFAYAYGNFTRFVLRLFRLE